jgi:hypothetical protein
MALEELLGETGLGLVEFPSEGLRGVRGINFSNISFIEKEMLAANIAEFAISLQARPGEQGPYRVDAVMATYISHKSNTLTYTCASSPLNQPRPSNAEYAFLFVSDCWKLREILNEEPLRLLATAPNQVLQKMTQSGWQFLPGVSSAQAPAAETLFLWSAKAVLLTEPTDDDRGLREKLRRIAGLLGLTERTLSRMGEMSG